jgi:hypothetical protein
VARRSDQPPPIDPYADGDLAELGLTRGESVRFRRRDGERWRPATVERRERDGSVGLRDGDGRARSVPCGQIEVSIPGPRGGLRWRPLPDRIESDEQRRLL